MTGTSSFAPIPTAAGWRCWGHDRAVAQFQRATESGPQHAYILGGPKHVGKTTLATEFARSLLCLHGIRASEPCGACATCRRILRGVHPDVTRFDLDRQILEDKGNSKQTTLTIQTIRQITSSLSLRPMEANWRVVLLGDAETMQEPAQEAFLKTLEEPPSYAIILMLATDPELLLETIRSRCQIRTLQPVPVATIEQCLQASGVENGRARKIAELAEGTPGWAFRAANEPALLEDREERRNHAARWVTGSPYERVVMAIQTADQFSGDRTDTFGRLTALTGVWRGVLLKRVGVGQEIPHCSDAKHHAPIEFSNSTIAELATAVESVQTCMSDLEANVRPRLALESMVLLWPKTDAPR